MMGVENWNRVREFFEQAIFRTEGIENKNDRIAAITEWLGLECDEKEAIKDKVMALVYAHLDEETFLEPHSALDVLGALHGLKDRNDRTEETLTEPSEGSLVDKYRIVSVIGRGGMGAVFLADRADGFFEQKVAIKLVRVQSGATRSRAGDLPERLRVERQILAGLNHPNIARLLDGGPSDYGPYLAMEFVEGEPIDLYCENLSLSVLQRMRLLTVVCEAVQYLHNNLVIHRDIKPSNILVTRDGSVKLLDFGVASLVDPFSGTSEQQRHITPKYAAPEQLTKGNINTSADVYALGCLLGELLVCTGDLAAIKEKATHQDPDRRYDTVMKLADEIERVKRYEPVLAVPHGAGYLARLFLRRNRIAVTVATVLVLSMFIGIGATLHQARIAERHFDQVRILSSSILSDLHNSIRDLPGATSARRLFADRAVAYLDTLSATGRLEIDAELARGYEQVAEIQGNPHYTNLGDLDGARESYQHALEIRRRIWQSDSSNSRSRLNYATTLGHMAVITSWNEDNTQAIRLSRRALALLEEVGGAEHVHGRIRSELGWWLIWDADAESGLIELDRATAALERLVTLQRDAVEIRLDLWRAYSYTVDGLRFTGRTAEALQLVESKGLPLLLETKSLAPEHPRTTYGMHVAYDYIGTLQAKLGRHQVAADAYEKSLNLARSLVESDPANQKAHEALARTQISRANVFIQLGKIDEAIHAFESAISIRERLFNDNPLNVSLGNAAGTGHRVLCRTMLQVHRPVRAREACRAGIELQQRVVSVSKGSPIVIGNLGTSYAYMARALSLLAEETPPGRGRDSLYSAALDWYGESLTTFDGISSLVSEFSLEVHPDTLRQEIRSLQSRLNNR